MNILCTLLGHKWQPVANGATKWSVCHVCLRCRENGWTIRTNW